MVRLPPTSLELPLLQHPQQLGLQVGGNLADFIQQNRAAVGQLEPPFPFVQRPGEGSLFVSKELAFNQVIRDGRAVDLDERSGGSRAFLV